MLTAEVLLISSRLFGTLPPIDELRTGTQITMASMAPFQPLGGIIDHIDRLVTRLTCLKLTVGRTITSKTRTLMLLLRVSHAKHEGTPNLFYCHHYR